MWKMVMTAAVVEPIGLHVYWSEKDKVSGGVRMVGQMYCLTTNFSSMHVKTGGGVMDIGQ